MYALPIQNLKYETWYTSINLHARGTGKTL